ncbi:unnamed protein product [Orchesella dallaii]|uniref:Uncharacterized protein n=1 Tax=Orchesella dallaii TaxID=48710 RepID=A0ABP1QPE9_9HEXA
MTRFGYRPLPIIPEEEFDPVAPDEDMFQFSQKSFKFSQSQTSSPSQRSQSSQYETPTGGCDSQLGSGSSGNVPTCLSPCMAVLHSFVHWLTLLSVILFVIGAIAIVAVIALQMQSTTCPIRKHEQISSQVESTSSSSPSFNNNNNPFFVPSNKEDQVAAEIFNNTESKGSIWIRKNWDRIKGLLTWIIHWIDENCNLECVLAKMGIWTEDI